MSDSQQMGRSPLELRVNGLVVESGYFRENPPPATGSELVISDPQIGCFALHEGFSLELREPGSDWEQVTLDEVKKTLSATDDFLRAQDESKAQETAEPRSTTHFDDVDAAHRAEHATVIAEEGEHIMRAEAALFRAGIPHLLLPFQKNKFASKLFMVPHLARAKACLRRAGFQVNFQSETILFDGRTGHRIQIIQGRCRLAEGES
jgi:hypothetical protein